MPSRHRIERERRRLNRIEHNLDNCLVIHYSCESFYEIEDGHTPRVTSIAVMSLRSGQVESFSISKIAEQKHIPLREIKEAYDSLELKMLEEYFEYVSAHLDMTWIHWNMRDISYGFKAIEHRYLILGGEPCVIPDENKVDLAMMLPVLYDKDYASHPRLPSLLLLNPTIANRDFLQGDVEAAAYANRDFHKLHQSTLRKVQVISDVLYRTIDGDLRTVNYTEKSARQASSGVLPMVAVSFVFGGLAGFIARSCLRADRTMQ